jgi:hypothetical protein
LLARLAACVPPPRFHTVRYAGMLAPASRWRKRIAAEPPPVPAAALEAEDAPPKRAGTYRPWAELLKRTLGFDVLACKTCGGRMKLLAVVTDPGSVARYLARLGEPSDIPARSPSRGPPIGRAPSCAERSWAPKRNVARPSHHKLPWARSNESKRGPRSAGANLCAGACTRAISGSPEPAEHPVRGSSSRPMRGRRAVGGSAVRLGFTYARPRALREIEQPAHTGRASSCGPSFFVVPCTPPGLLSSYLPHHRWRLSHGARRRG